MADENDIIDPWAEQDPIDPWEGRDFRKEEVEQYEEQGGGFMSGLERGLRRMDQSWNAAAAGLGDYVMSKTPESFQNSDVGRWLQGQADQDKQDVIDQQGKIDQLPVHPTTQRMASRANQTDSITEGLGLIAEEFMASPDKSGWFVDTMAEQIPVFGAMAIGTKGAGNVLGTATKLGSAGTFATGAAIGSGTATFGTNVAQALGNDTSKWDEAMEYAATRSMAQGIVDGTVGAFVPFKLGPNQMVNIPVQAILQAVGGSTGEYAASTAVGEEVQTGDLLLEGVLELMSLPVDVALARIDSVNDQAENKPWISQKGFDRYGNRLDAGPQRTQPQTDAAGQRESVYNDPIEIMGDVDPSTGEALGAAKQPEPSAPDEKEQKPEEDAQHNRAAFYNRMADMAEKNGNDFAAKRFRNLADKVNSGEFKVPDYKNKPEQSEAPQEQSTEHKSKPDDFSALFDEAGKKRFPNSSAVKDFMAEHDLNLDAIREIQKTVMSGGSISIDEARAKGVATAEARAAKRDYEFSEEGRLESDSANQQRLQKEQDERDQYIDSAGPIEPGFYKDKDLDLKLELLPSGMIVEHRNGEIIPYGTIKKGQSDANGVGFVSQVKNGIQVADEAGSQNRIPEPKQAPQPEPKEMPEMPEWTAGEQPSGVMQDAFDTRYDAPKYATEEVEPVEEAQPEPEPAPQAESPFVIEDITEKAFAVTGEDTREIKESLKELKGVWNRKRQAWVFAKKHRPAVENLLKEYEGFKREKAPQAESPAPAKVKPAESVSQAETPKAPEQKLPEPEQKSPQTEKTRPAEGGMIALEDFKREMLAMSDEAEKQGNYSLRDDLRQFANVPRNSSKGWQAYMKSMLDEYRPAAQEGLEYEQQSKRNEIAKRIRNVAEEQSQEVKQNKFSSVSKAIGKSGLPEPVKQELYADLDKAYSGKGEQKQPEPTSAPAQEESRPEKPESNTGQIAGFKEKIREFAQRARDIGYDEKAAEIEAMALRVNEKTPGLDELIKTKLSQAEAIAIRSERNHATRQKVESEQKSTPETQKPAKPEETAETAQPEPEKLGPKKQFADNKIFTADKVAEARARIKSKIGRMNSGFDPEMLSDGMTIAGAYVEAGIRDFTEYAEAMISDFGNEIKPFLLSFWEGVRYYPGLDTEGMTGILKSKVAFDEINAESGQKVVDSEPQSTKGADDEPQVSATEDQGSSEGPGQVQDDAGVRAEQRDAGPRQDDNEGEGSPDADTDAGSASGERSDTGNTEAPGLFLLDTVEDVANGTASQRVAANIKAIRTMKQILSENRQATPEEKAVMARYVGWGGLDKVFDNAGKRAKFQVAADKELRELLTDTEYNDIRSTISTAFYTSKDVVKAMWAGVEAFGLTGKMRVLEPSVGSGNFIGWQPEAMREQSKWSAAEMDSVTGNIAKLIYDDANVQVRPFEQTPFKDNVFTLAIGNPPFGSRPLHDKKNPDISGLSIHNYFIAKSAKLLHENGLMAMVITHRFLDTKNPNHKNLSKLVDFVGAVRLPNTAFKSNAGTEVTTDIVVFRKLKEGETASNTIWTDTEGKIGDVKLNKYFEQNPQNILGKPEMTGTMYAGNRGGEFTVTPTEEHADLQKSITEAMKRLAEGKDLSLTDEQVDALAGDEVMLAETDLPIGGMMLNAEGKIMIREDDQGGGASVVEVTPDMQWSDSGEELVRTRDLMQADQEAFEKHFAENLVGATGKLKSAYSSKGWKAVEEYSKGKITKAQAISRINVALEGTKLKANRYHKLKDMLRIRNAALALIRAEKTDADNIEVLRKRLNQHYDNFAKAYARTKKEPATLDQSLALLRGDLSIESGLDSFDKATGAIRKHDIFDKRMIQRYTKPSKASSIDDAVAYSIQEQGRVSPEYVAELMGITEQQALDKLTSGANPYLFEEPDTGNYVYIDEYLSGNVKEKHRLAVRAGMMDNAAKLREVFPEDKKPEQITPSIRAAWTDESVFEDFLKELGVTANVAISRTLGQITANGRSTKSTDLGAQFQSKHKTIEQIFNAAANGKTMQVGSYDENRRFIKNEEATKEVNTLANKMADMFVTWARTTDGVLQQIAKNFNERINTHVERRYNGRLYFKPVGQNPAISMRKTQLDGAVRMVLSKNVLLDHTVGAGKTFTAISGVMQRKRLGLSKKPLIVVPNHIIGPFTSDFYKLYPGANVLAASEKQMSAAHRRQFFSRIATGDYDAVIIGHSHLKALPSNMADFEAVINEKIEELRAALEEKKKEAKASGGRGATTKQIEDSITRLKEKIQDKKKKLAEGGDSVGFDFSDLGIDYMVVDEAHEFKNLMYSTSADRIVGMNDPNGSERAMDLLIKVRSTQKLENGGVTFMTGTPISNSLVEIYTMMYYLGYDELKSNNITHYDAFAGSFFNTASTLEYTATGTVKERMVLKGLSSAKELTAKYRMFGDVITHGDMVRIFKEDQEAQNRKNGTDKSTRFPIPKIKGGKRTLDIAPATAGQKAYNDYLIARMEAMEQIKGRQERQEYAKIDNPLWVLSDARKASLDIRLVDPRAARDENGKVARASKRIKGLYDQWTKDKGTQLVFSDMGTPAKYAKANTQKDLAELAGFVMPEKKAKQYVKDRMAANEGEEAYSLTLQDINDKIDIAIGKGTLDGDDQDKALTMAKELEGQVMSADTGFSVYDDLKEALIEQGIPENEIAFIHDYNTAAKKEELFSQVNAGQIRVLVGSTPKMGAGTNVQERLVGLHHLDAPWRPSDMEQREGRIIRQGNKLYQRDPDNFEVDIVAYATQGSSDPVMWQILERKAAAIEQFRSGGLDEFVDDSASDADSYAEFKASTTGNPIYRQKLQSDADLLRKRTDYNALLSSTSSAKRIIEEGPDQIRSYKDKIGRLKDFDIAAYDVEAHEKAVTEMREQYAKDIAEYEKAQEEWEKLGDKAKKNGIKKPQKPTRPSLYDVDSDYARALKAELVDPVQKMIGGKGGKQTFGLGGDNRIDVELEYNAAHEQYRIQIDWSKGDMVVAHDVWWVKTFAASDTIQRFLQPSTALREAEREIVRLQDSIKERESAMKDAEKTAKISIGKEKRTMEEAQTLNDWLAVEVKLADIKEEIRRGKTPNQYIDSETKRNVKRSLFDISKLKRSAYTFAGKDYETLGPGFPAPNYNQYFYPALDDDGNYIHLLIERKKLDEKSGTGQAQFEYDPIEVREKPDSAPEPEYEFLKPAPAKKTKRTNQNPKARAAGERQKKRLRLIQHKRTDKQGKGIAPGAAKLAGLAWLKRFKGAAGTKLVTYPNLAEAYKAGLFDDPEAVVKGGYEAESDTLYLVADQFDSIDDLRSTMQHEIIVHKGLGVMSANDATRFLIDVAKATDEDSELGAIMADVQKLYADKSPATQVEEVIARLAERRMSFTDKAWNRLKAVFNRLLRALGLQSDTLTKSEIIDKLYRIGDALIEGRQARSRSADTDATMFAQKDSAANKGEIQYQRVSPETLQQSIDAQSRSIFEKVRGLIGKGGGDSLAEAVKRNWLGALTLQQLAEMSEKVMPQIKQYAKTVQLMLTERNTLAEKAADIVEDWQKWAAKNKAEADKQADLMHDATLAMVDPSEEFVSMAEHLQKRIKSLETLILSQSGSQSNKYNDELVEARAMLKSEPERFKAWKRLKPRWDALSPEAQQYYRKIRNEYKDRHDRFKQILTDRIEMSELQGKVKRQMLSDLRYHFETQELSGPYFPLSRFGQYWLEAIDQDGQRVYMMFESEREQKQAEKNIKADGFHVAGKGHVLDKTPGQDGASLGFVSDLIQQVEGTTLNDQKKGEVTDAIYQLYLQALPSRSMRKQFIHRKGVAGYSSNAIRGFAENMMKQSYQIARLGHIDQLSDLVKEMEKSASQGGNNQAHMYNEMLKRHEWVKNPQNSSLAHKLTGLGFVWMLGVSPAAAAVNLTQTPVIAFPVLGARFGWMSSAKELLKAARSFSLRKGELKPELMDDVEKQAYQEWKDMGLLDSTRAHDLAGIAEYGGYQYSDTQEKWMQRIAYLFHRAEQLNREATALAAFRLARRKGLNYRKAVDDAAELTWKSHYDYGNTNRARFMQNDFMKVATQFKQYSQNTTWYLFRSLERSFKGESPEEKAIARRQLVGTLGMTALIGGINALPLSVIFGLASAAFGDEDEPYDARVEFHLYLADIVGKDAANDIMYGAGGAGISSRVSLNDLWIRDPNRDLEGQDLWSFYAMQAAGPVVGGILPSFIEGFRKFGQGEYSRGVENMVPKFVKDGIKAVRYADEGATTLKGDELKDKDDFSYLDLGLQAMGIADADVNRQYAQNQAIKNYEQHILNRRKLLLFRYYVAIKERDEEMRADVLKKIQRFNQKNPRIRIDAKSIRTSMRSRLRSDREAISGISVNKRLRPMAAEMEFANN